MQYQNFAMDLRITEARNLVHIVYTLRLLVKWLSMVFLAPRHLEYWSNNLELSNLLSAFRVMLDTRLGFQSHQNSLHEATGSFQMHVSRCSGANTFSALCMLRATRFRASTVASRNDPRRLSDIVQAFWYRSVVEEEPVQV
jgi:hypothetical protein